MILLASRSPQRRRLLSQYGISFRLVRSSYQERTHRRLKPRQLARKHALGKVRGVRQKKGLIIGADTLVAYRGRVFGKPKDRRDAARMLKRFSGHTQSIISGVALRDVVSGREMVFVVTSYVTFHPMTKSDIQSYLDTGEYRGKSGSFALQGKASHLIKRVKGSRTNIIGLPMKELRGALRRFKRRIG